MINIFYSIAGLWVCWLLLDGLLTGKVWVKGGAKDRFSRSISMHSFAHKVSREESPIVYWLNIFLYIAFIALILWVMITG